MLLTEKTKDEYKKELYVAQGGKCPLCKRDLDRDVLKNHLDHDHALDGAKQGRCRGLLCVLCNGAEGEIAHAFYHSGLQSRGVDRRLWLETLLDYWDKDTTMNPLFPSYPRDKTKSFSRLTRPEMIAIMDAEGYEYDEKDTREKLTKKYGKALRKSLKTK